MTLPLRPPVLETADQSSLIAADGSAWDHSVLLPAPSVRRLQLGERTALFCARRQQLYELNPTADVIWLGLAEGRPPVEVAQALAGGSARALGFVRDAATGWVRGGLLAPQLVRQMLSGEPVAQWTFELEPLRVGLRLYGELDTEAVTTVFGQFFSDAPPTSSLSAVGSHGLVFLFDGEEPLGAFDENAWIAELKAALTERYTQGVADGFLTHGALLSRGDKSVLLWGEPGAGKTTLTVALTAAGFDYHADDIVRFDAEGLATGAPFSPAVKRGAWEILAKAAPALRSLPVYLRSDGQEVKYLPVTQAERRAVRLSAVLLLQRQADVAAHIEPVEPLDILTTLLGSAYSARGSIDADVLAALAETVNGARGGRLVYAGLDDAVAAVSEILA